ncbi:hypothetical protein ILUMI_16666 [Ignelater luminosus]|uniref:DUF5641 domain-containing protein n=1 Tax=Ignelater luminosus TaxID=2038154 RepID=A0A8K0CSH5_IGNLU|nr:hypothetical protein ILUMI_16666 [Ignelater luminosus]
MIQTTAVLTPAHFIIGHQLTAIPERNLLDSKVNFRNRIQHLQYLRQQFWAKWSFDYLHNLQQRTKWQFSRNSDLTIGAVVLLKEDILPVHWRLGRILAIHPGKDGVVRVVSVRTKTGVSKRALSKVCLLPPEEVQISDK